MKYFDRVKVNIATLGTGDVTFGSAVSSAFLTPVQAGAADGDVTPYVIVDGTDFEEGEMEVSASGAEGIRTVSKSVVSGVVGASKLNLSGTATLTFTVRAADLSNLLEKSDNLAGLTDAAAALTNLGGTTVGKAVFTAADAAAARTAIEAITGSDYHAASSKTTPVDADEIPLVDSAASWGLKKLTWANLKAAITGAFGSAATKDVGTLANNVPQLDGNGKLLNAVMGASSIGASGYYTLPGGLIVQWGITPAPVSGASSTTFPIAFPNACASVTLTINGFSSGTSGLAVAMVASMTTTGFTSTHRFSNGAVSDSSSVAKYIAIGY